jgi:hypothetical protein
MGCACGTQMNVEKVNRTLTGNLKRREYLGDLNIQGTIILHL